MSDFFDDLGKAFRRVANDVSSSVSIAAQEQRLQEAYQALGRMYYEAVQSGTAAQGPAFDSQMTAISDLIAAIRETRRNQNVTDV